MNLQKQKILVTGGAGFIGASLVKKLKEIYAQVDIFDINTGHNLEDTGQLRNFIKKKYDVIYHLAGISGSINSLYIKENSFKINSFPVVDLCELIVKHSPKTKLIISSSRLEYGNPQYLPVDENHPTIPTSIYGLSKLIATQIALVYHQKNNLNVTIFRTSNVYGPHPPSKFSGYNVINHFIDLAKKDKTLEIYGDGNQLRDYLFIDDLIEAFILALFKNTAGQIYNLGYGQKIKFKDMAYLITRKVGKGKIKFVPWPKNAQAVETGSYVTNLTKIRNELGFMPKTTFEKGVQKTIVASQ